ncbi:hypothetical protein CERSUDRAFT_86071 [Gelatoporia subvermispora B]|uniref:F-box domain-containing protein n=1 Tax=Ceriporiopsis subvermispora (strain B) TaxID=914234 RepID=M2QCB3_CERS8|nr:hypothetical protein CERSUDRAFT_86071 [Gelatoporia subvermispora B]
MGQSSSHTIATQLLSSPVGSVSSYGGSWSQTAGSHGRCGHLVGLILPLEIWDEIIDYFGEAGDRLTLSSCALVCRAWLPRARSHLFRVIYVHTPRHLRRLTKALDRSPEIPPLIKDYTLCPDEEAAEVVSRGLKLLSRLPQVIEVTISPSHLCPDTVAGLLPPLKLMPVPSSVRYIH